MRTLPSCTRQPIQKEFSTLTILFQLLGIKKKKKNIFSTPDIARSSLIRSSRYKYMYWAFWKLLGKWVQLNLFENLPEPCVFYSDPLPVEVSTERTKLCCYSNLAVGILPPTHFCIPELWFRPPGRWWAFLRIILLPSIWSWPLQKHVLQTSLCRP